MATLHIYESGQASRPVASLDDLRTLIPFDPRIPSLFVLEYEGGNTQVHFGDPDRQHHTVKMISAFGVEKQVFDSIEAARETFFDLAQTAF